MKISEEVVFLEGAFDVLNEKYFESALSRPAITIQSTPRAHGHFTPYDAWDNCGLKLKEINLGAESLHRPVANVIATLMHEMVHYYCHVQGIKDVSRGNTYYNKRFKEEAEKRGLIISYSAGIGYSVTYPSPTMVALVQDLGWTNKLQLYRNRDCKISSGTNKNGNSSIDTIDKKKSSTIFHPFHSHKGHGISWGQTRTMEYKKSLFEMDEIQNLFDRGISLVYTAKSNSVFLVQIV